MADGATTNYGFVLPEVNSSDDTWGDKLNQNWVDLDAQLNTIVGRTISAGDGLTGGGSLAANRTLSVDSTVVRTTRTLTAGDGLSGGGDLTLNRSFAVDSTVVRTTRSITAGNGLSGGGALSADRTITMGAPSTLSGTTGNGTTATSHTHGILSSDIRNSTSTEFLLNLKGMNDHRLSGDHDGRYYQKSEFSTANTANTPVIRDTAGDIRARLFRSTYTPTSSTIAALYTTQNTLGTDFMRMSTPAQVMAAIGGQRTITAGEGLIGGGDLSANRTITLGTPGTLSGITGNGTSAGSHTHTIATSDSRTSTSTTFLLNLKGMNDHRLSGDHDARYAQLSGGNDANFAIMPQVAGRNISESGGNSNGLWTRLSCGLQVCSTSKAFSDYSNNRMNVVWFFPQPFVNGQVSATHNVDLGSVYANGWNLDSLYAPTTEAQTGSSAQLHCNTSNQSVTAGGGYTQIVTRAMANGAWR